MKCMIFIDFHHFITIKSPFHPPLRRPSPGLPTYPRPSRPSICSAEMPTSPGFSNHMVMGCYNDIMRYVCEYNIYIYIYIYMISYFSYLCIIMYVYIYIVHVYIYMYMYIIIHSICGKHRI